MGVWGGSREEAAWASDRRVWAAALKNTGTQGRWEVTAAFFLDVLNADRENTHRSVKQATDL